MVAASIRVGVFSGTRSRCRPGHQIILLSSQLDLCSVGLASRALLLRDHAILKELGRRPAVSFEVLLLLSCGRDLSLELLLSGVLGHVGDVKLSRIV